MIQKAEMDAFAHFCSILFGCCIYFLSINWQNHINVYFQAVSVLNTMRWNQSHSQTLRVVFESCLLAQ